MKTLLVINGHPDPRPERFCAGLSSAYQEGAEAGGWEVRRLDIGACSLSMLEALKQGCDDTAKTMLDDMAWADRLVIVYPLWFGQPPQGLRTVFSYLEKAQVGPVPGRKAHLIVTMDMPAFAYRNMLRPGGSELLQMLDVPGLIADEPVLVGCVSALEVEQRQRWIVAMRDYGLKTTLGSRSMPPRSASLGAIIDRTVAQWWGAL